MTTKIMVDIANFSITVVNVIFIIMAGNGAYHYNKHYIILY